MLTRNGDDGPLVEGLARPRAAVAGAHCGLLQANAGEQCLSNDVGVSGPSPSDGDGRAEISENGAGVLANLPRTRPQRATARRAASRRGGATGRAAPQAGNGAEPAKTATKTRQPVPRPRKARATTQARSAPASAAKAAEKTAQPRRAPRPRKISPVVEPAPRQGYECLEERATGAVPPPGGADLVNTALEALSELAKASLSGGERLLRDVLSRLPR